MTIIEFLMILIVNAIVAVVYLIIQWINNKEDKKAIMMKTLIMLLCPIAGALFLGFGFFFYKVCFSKEVDLADVVFSKERVKTYAYADEERERNMVSLEEALAITDKDNLRTLMLNVIRGDIKKSLASISLALNSEDSETSHYAASVLQDALNDFRGNVQKTYQEIKKEREEQILYANMLVDYMDQVLRQKVFTDIEQKSFVFMMEEVCEILYTKAKEDLTSVQLENIALRLLEIEEYVYCKKWCERSIELYPDTLSTYTCQLKLYFSNGEREMFFMVLDKLRNSNIVIDNETLQMMRTFL